MISDGQKDYELVYSMKRIKMIEAAMKGRSFITAMSGFPSISDLITICAYGLRESGKVGWISPLQGSAIAEQAIEEQGLMEVYKDVSEALERDCGFLFRVSD